MKIQHFIYHGYHFSHRKNIMSKHWLKHTREFFKNKRLFQIMQLKNTYFNIVLHYQLEFYLFVKF